MQIKNRQQFLLIGAVIAVSLLAADRLVRAPLAASWRQSADQIASLRKQVAEGKNWLQRERLQTKLVSIALAIPRFGACRVSIICPMKRSVE